MTLAGGVPRGARVRSPYPSSLHQEDYKLSDILRVRMSAGKIRRYHTAPLLEVQTVADHTYGVCQILRHILDDNVPSQLFKAALDHDVCEFWLGDMPHPTKKAFPELNLVIKTAEEAIDKKNGLWQELTEKDIVCLKAADLLESSIFGMRQHYMGNDYGLSIMDNIFKAMASLDSAILPQKAKDMWIEMENYYVSQ